jgi:hypothetical protein
MLDFVIKNISTGSLKLTGRDTPLGPLAISTFSTAVLPLTEVAALSRKNLIQVISINPKVGGKEYTPLEIKGDFRVTNISLRSVRLASLYLGDWVEILPGETKNVSPYEVSEASILDAQVEGVLHLEEVLGTMSGASIPTWGNMALGGVTWIGLVTGWALPIPYVIGTVAQGSVYFYTMADGSTYYRLVPSTVGGLDAFYSSFGNGILSGLVVARSA